MALPSPARGWSAHRVVLALLLAYVAAVLAADAVVTAARFDDQVLEQDLLELSWKLQLPWRASHGEWAGRDFVFPLGPLFQFLAWAGGGFRFRSAASAIGGHPLAFAAAGLALAGWIAARAVEGPWRRLLAFAACAVAVLWSETATLQAMSLVAVALLYAPVPGAEEERPSLRRAAPAALALSLAALLSVDLAGLGIAGVALAAGYEAIGRRIQRRRVAPAALRLGEFLACLLAWQALLAALLWLGGSTLIEQYGLLGELPGPLLPGTTILSDPRTVEGPIGLLVGIAALAALYATRAGADLPAGMWLAAAAPSLLTALVRGDAVHGWLAIAPAGLVTLTVALRAAGRRSATVWPAGVLAALLFSGWFGAHPGPLAARGPAVVARAARALLGDERPDRSYQSTMPRVVAFARARKAAGDRCIGAYPGGDVLHALADLPGPTTTLLRGSESQRAAVAREIERQRCPYLVQRLGSFDLPGEGAAAIGVDFLAIARLYEPDQPLGPDVWALRLRAQPAPESSQEIAAAGLGARQQVPVPGVLEVRLAAPIDSSHLVRLDGTLEMSPLRGRLDGVPSLTVEFLDGDAPLSRVRAAWSGVNHRTSLLVPVHPAHAEARWLLGEEPRPRRTADRLRLTLATAGGATPSSVGLTLHAVHDLAPGGAPNGPVEGCAGRLDLLEEVLQDRALPRAARVSRTADGLLVRSGPAPGHQAELFVPVRPCEDTCLRVRGVTLFERGDDVRFQAHAIAGGARELLLDRLQVPDGQPRELEAPLTPWAGRPILLRLGVQPGAAATFDWALIREARVGPCDTRFVARELQTGRAQAVDATPSLDGLDVFLHPNGPGDPPASVRVPLRPAPSSCLIATPRLRPAPGPGDGVTFFGEIEAGGRRRPLFAAHLAPHDPPREIRAPLDAWSGRDVTIVLGTLPGATANYDWAIFGAPRVGACAP